MQVPARPDRIRFASKRRAKKKKPRQPRTRPFFFNPRVVESLIFLFFLQVSGITRPWPPFSMKVFCFCVPRAITKNAVQSSLLGIRAPPPELLHT